MYQELTRNIPGGPDWEGSFYEILTEYGEWNIEAFWRLHYDLIDIANNECDKMSIDRELAYYLLFIQQRILNLISAHFVINDTFKITNITQEQIYQFKERFELAIIGAITGEVLPEKSFDLKKPLIKN